MEPNFENELSWARRHMPMLRYALSYLPDLSSVRLALSIHLDLKIVLLIEGLLERGAACFLVTCNPTTVRDEVVGYLRERGAHATAWRDMPPEAYNHAIQEALEWAPTHLCEFGADLSAAIRDLASKAPTVRASLEGTGSGIARLENWRPLYPVYNWDDLPVKEGLHNRHMVGLTTWQAFFERTHLTLHGKRVIVIGYGLVGQGVAATARAFGGAVTIVDKDPVRSLQAAYEGWRVLPLQSALQEADVVVTATGVSGIISADQFEFLQEGVFLLNVGHKADEIDVAALYSHPHREVMPFIDEIEIEAGVIYLLAGGSMANLTAGYGDSLNAFDLTLAILTAGIGFITAEGEQRQPGIYILPRSVWGPFISPA